MSLVMSLQRDVPIIARPKCAGGDMKPTAYTVNDACRLPGIGRAMFYKLAKEGTIKTRKLGTRTLVLAKDLEEFVNGLPAGPGA